MAEMKIGYSGNYPYVEINFFFNEEREKYRLKVPMSKMWYKDLIYEIEKVAEEEKKNAEKFLHENDRKKMMHSFDIYTKLVEVSQGLKNDLEMDSEGVILNQAS